MASADCISHVSQGGNIMDEKGEIVLKSYRPWMYLSNWVIP